MERDDPRHVGFIFSGEEREKKKRKILANSDLEWMDTFYF